MTTFTQLAPASSDPPEPFTDRLRLAVAAYLARFKGSSREHTESDLRCYLAWCAERGLDPLAARRPHLELYIRSMQEIRRFKPSTVSRRFSVTAGFYRTCVLDGLLQHSPAEHVRRPAVPAESPTLGFTHLQFEALLTAARESPNPSDFALVAMLGLLGLRIFEATGADIANLGEEHGHRVLRVCGKGSKVVQVPLPPAVSRAIDRAAGLRDGGPILLNRRGTRMDRHAATRRLRHLADTAGLRAKVHPHMLRHTFVTTMQMGRIASAASFGRSREHALPAAQRAVLRWRQPAGRHGGCGDLGLHGPPVSDATTMQLMPLRGLHHRCDCWHRDTSGCSRRRRMHHGVPGEWRRGGRGCCADPGPPARDTRPDLGVHNLGCGGCQDVASDPIVPNVFIVAVDALACGGCWCPGRERPRGRLRWCWWTARRRCGPRPRCSRRCWRAGGASRWRGG